MLKARRTSRKAPSRKHSPRTNHRSANRALVPTSALHTHHLHNFTTTATGLDTTSSTDFEDARIRLDDEAGELPDLATPKVQPNRLKIKHLTKLLQAMSLQPQREAWWIIASKSGIPENVLRQAAKFNQPGVPDPDIDVSPLLNAVQLAAVHDALKQRIEQRKPLQYVLGDVEFCKLKLSTKEGILIPRPETEQITSWLVHQIKLYNQYVLREQSVKNLGPADVPESQENIQKLIDNKTLLDYTEQVDTYQNKYPLHRFRWSWHDAIENPFTVQQKLKQNEGQMSDLEYELNNLKIFDLCCGSGNISLALAAQLPLSRVTGVDIDPKALALSRLNQTNLNIKNAQFFHCDVFQNSIYQANPQIYTTPTPAPVQKRNPLAQEEKRESIVAHPFSSEEGAKMSVSFNPSERFIGLYDLTMLTSLADIIVSNPPYIREKEMPSLDPEVQQWENHFALTPFEHIYRHPDVGKPYIIPDSYTARSSPEQRAKLPKWPTITEIYEHALPFYERIITNAPRLLTHNEHYIPKQNIKFPRLVLEIGHEEQAMYVADMASYIFDVELYLDAYDRVRWVVGYEPKGYSH